MNQAVVVYKIPCDDCDALYVGETERQLEVRFNEHKRASSPATTQSTTSTVSPKPMSKFSTEKVTGFWWG